MRTLVTGGAGFIGSNLVDALLARGDQVAVVDDLSTGREENLEFALAGGATLHRADIRDTGELERIFAAERPEQVFHTAAQIDVRRSVADPGHDARSTWAARSTCWQRRWTSGSRGSSTRRPAARCTGRPR